MRIVHLATDEKFVPLAQSMFEEAFPGQSRYLVARARRGDRRYVAPSSRVRYLGSLRLPMRWLAPELAAADCVVVHTMTSRFAPALRHLHRDCLVVWISGGGDYMQLLEPQLGSLLLPRTAALLHGLDSAPRRAGRVALRARLRAWAVPARAVPAVPRPPPVVSIAPRIDVFSANPADAVLLRNALPSLRATLHVIPAFTVEDVFATGTPTMAGPDVLLGNSASPTNNHLEALALLEGRLPQGGRAVVPLSYGQAHPAYVGAVVEAGRAALGERFEPLVDWMPIEAYNTCIARCGVVFMNHRRQRAVGNIGAAMYRGASVYLRRDNPLFGFFVGLGAQLHAIETLEADPQAPLLGLAPEQQQRNRRVIEARYGRERVVAAIRALEGFRRRIAPAA